MSEINQHHAGEGNNIVNMAMMTPPRIDVGLLNDILQNEASVILSVFNDLEERRDNNQSSIDESTTPIQAKNRLNNLEEFYNEFIKIEESKLFALQKFFNLHDYVDKIETASHSFRIEIFSRNDRHTNKLNASTFNEIIQECTRSQPDDKRKEIMRLILFYLYRFCFIGAKE